MDQKAFDRFIDKIEFTDHCWFWTAHKNRQGYGQFGLEGKVLKAHRVSYELFVCPIPPGLSIDHACEVTSCVNPDHLSVMTNESNARNYWRSSDIECRAGHLRAFYQYKDAKGFYVCSLCRKLRDSKRRPKQSAQSRALKTKEK